MSLLTRTLIGASVPFALVILYVISMQRPAPAIVPLLDIGVEHTQPMTLSLTLTRNDALQMVEIGNDAKEEVAVSLPEQWTRGEVRRAKIADIRAEDPSFGYVRWTLPKNAAVVFRSDTLLEHLNIHNPSGVLLKIRLTTVDLQKNSGVHEVYLVKEGSVKIP